MGKKSVVEPDKDDLEIPTSMIDVVFLLLIFFLVATRIKVPEEKLDAFLPKDEGLMSKAEKIEIFQDINVQIAIASDNNTPILKVGDVSVYSFKELETKLATLHRNQPESAVVLIGNGNTPFMFMLATLDACAVNGITNVKFQAPGGK